MSPTVRWLQLVLIFILFIAVFILGLSFYFRNDQMVVIDYFLGSKEYYFSFWLLSFMTLGIILGWIT